MGPEGALTHPWAPDTISFSAVIVTMPDCSTFQQQHKTSPQKISCLQCPSQRVSCECSQYRDTGKQLLIFLEIFEPDNCFLLELPMSSLQEGYSVSPSTQALALSAYGPPLSCISVSFLSHQIENRINLSLKD